MPCCDPCSNFKVSLLDPAPGSNVTQGVIVRVGFNKISKVRIVSVLFLRANPDGSQGCVPSFNPFTGATLSEVFTQTVTTDGQQTIVTLDPSGLLINARYYVAVTAEYRGCQKTGLICFRVTSA